MQYMLLIYGEESKEPEYGTPEFEQYMSDYFAFSNDIEKSGHMLAGDALQDRNTATTVSVRKGETVTIDGPFAETKEQLGGYYLIEAKDLDEAVEIAAKIPTAKHGRIEVRAIMDYSNS